MTTYLALVKVPVPTTEQDVRRDVPTDLEILAGRLVAEYCIGADEVEEWFGRAIDAAHEAQVEIES